MRRRRRACGVLGFIAVPGRRLLLQQHGAPAAPAAGDGANPVTVKRRSMRRPLRPVATTVTVAALVAFALTVSRPPSTCADATVGSLDRTA